MKSDIKFFILEMAFLVGIIVLLIVGVNSCSASKWNDGICPNCNVRYELRGASRGLKITLAQIAETKLVDIKLREFENESNSRRKLI